MHSVSVVIKSLSIELSQGTGYSSSQFLCVALKNDFYTILAIQNFVVPGNRTSGCHFPGISS